MSVLLARKVRRDLWLHRTRTLLVVVAIAVALAGGGIVLVAWAMVRAATDEGFRASLPVSATLTLDSVDDGLLDAVRAMPEVAAARARRTLRAAVEIDGSRRNAVLYALSDFQDATIARLRPQAGAWPPPRDGLVVERSSVEFARTSVGQVVALNLGDTRVEVPVRGIVRDVSLAPGWMEQVVYGYVDASLLARLGAPDGFDELQVRVRDERADRAAVRSLVARVATLARAAGHRIVRVDVPVPGQHVHAAQMNSLLMTQGAFAGLALLVCAFLIVNLLAAMLAGESRVIGVLKALGAAPARIARHYLAHTAAIGALASLVALPVAAFLGMRYGRLKLELLNFPAEDAATPFAALALLGAIGIVVPVLAALAPVRRATRGSVADALREDRVEAGALTGARWSIPGRSLLPVASRWALDNAFRRPRRTALVVLSLALGGAVFLGATSLREAVIGSVDRLFASMRYDIALAWRSPPSAASVEAILAATPGVDAAESWRRAIAAVEGEDGLVGDDFELIGVPAATRVYVPSLRAGRALRADDRRALLVNRGLLDAAPGARVGSTVRLRVGAATHVWTIVGVVDGPPNPQAYAPTDAVAEAADGAGSMLVVRSIRRDLAGQLDLVQRLRSAFEAAGTPVGRSGRPDETRRAIEDHLLMVVDFLGAMAWVMVFVGAMGLASTMGIAVLERVREIGVLRALGARHVTLVGLVQLESLVLALAGFALAVPLSMPASKLLGDAFGRVFFRVVPQLLPGADALGRWLVASLLVASIAAVAPALRAVRLPVATALRQE